MPTDTLAIDLSIGAQEGNGPDVFGRVAGVVGDADGRIFVADAQSHAIRVFEPTGAFLYTFGREGAGPGELSGPCCLAIDPSGRLWVREAGNARYSIFRPHDGVAEFEATHRLAHSDANYQAPITFTAGGGFIDLGHRPTPAGPSLLSRIRRSSAGDEVDAVPVTTPDLDALGRYAVEVRGSPVRSTRYFYQPFGEEHLVAHGPDGIWADGVSSGYRVTVRSAEGEIVIRSEGTEGPLLSDRERTVARERLASIAESAGSTVAALPFGVPNRKPVMRRLFFDSQANLWVELTTTDGSMREADVWSREGVHLRTVRWPSDVVLGFPGWIGTDAALGIRRDGLGIEYVVRLTDRRSF